MNQTKQKIAYSITAFFALFFVLLTTFLSPFGLHAVAFADEGKDIVSEYEETNVWDNLQGSTIAGNAFNPEDFPHTEKDNPRVLSFVEFCYSLYSDNRDDYGLYVYLYNPQDLVFDTATSRNKIQIRCGKGIFEPYNLVFLNYSKEAGYEGRFWKFKVNLTETQKQNILKNLAQGERVYEVSGITLSVKTVATEYTCAQKYTYSGYVKGYGSELAEGDTLSCKVDGFENYLEPEVKQTCYRPVGDYYNGIQSQLNSCYFRIPEKYFTDYGELTRILCEWWEYKTQPILVTETNSIYQKLYNLHGADVKNFSPNTVFLITAYSFLDNDSWIQYKADEAFYFSNVAHDEWETDGYREGVSTMPEGFYDNWEEYERNNFAAVFLTPNATSYKDTFITSEQLTAELLKNSEILGGEKITDRYSAALFTDEVDRGHERGYNKKLISRDKKQELFWHTTTKGFWQTLFGGYDVKTDSYEADAIYEITKEDLKGTDDEIAARLLVAAKDVASIKAEFSKCNKERLVLLRYGVSDYSSLYCVESTCSANTEDRDAVLVHDTMRKLFGGLGELSHEPEFTAYIAQETVYLDFDIISLWFTAEDGSETEIPVVMSPQDVISGLNPPLDIGFHNGKEKAIIILIIVILALILLVLVLYYTGLLPAASKGVAWVVCAPFKGIAAISRSISERRREKQMREAAEKYKAPKRKSARRRSSTKSKTSKSKSGRKGK